MAESIEIIEKRNYLLAVYIGKFSVQAARQTIDQIVQAIPENRLRAVLLDCRNLTGRLSIMDRYQTAIYGQHMIGRVSKLALVRPREMIGADRFMETVAVNRGIYLRLFEDIGEAIAWLEG